MPNIQILKIGGSVFTYKERISELNDAAIKSIISEINEWFLEKESDARLILTSGAGSFGHPLAHQYEINNFNSEKDNLGFVRIVSNMQKMGQYISELAHQCGLPLFPIPASSVFCTYNGRITKCNLDIISNGLEKGIIPFLWGDAVFDLLHKYRILSGDQINTYLYNELNANALYYGTNVDGVYWDNPTINKDAKLINDVNNSNYQSMLKHTTPSLSTIDVTDGMRGKILEIYQIKKRPVRCVVYNALTKGNTYNVLKGKKIGTEINFA